MAIFPVRTTILASAVASSALAFNTPLASLRLAPDGSMQTAIAGEALLSTEELGIPMLAVGEVFQANHSVPCVAPACPQACFDCRAAPLTSVPFCEGAASACSLPCTPCEENAVLRARVNELQDDLHSAQSAAYTDGLARAAASHAELAHNDQLMNRLTGAYTDLEREHSEHLEALDRAHEAELADVRAELGHSASQAAHAAYLTGLAEGAPDAAAEQGFADMAVDAAVAQAGQRAAEADQALHDARAYRDGEAIGGLLASGATTAEELGLEATEATAAR